MEPNESVGVLSVGATTEAVQIPSQGGGIEAIATLAKAGQQLEFVMVETTGLGEGLPDRVPLAVDRATHKVYDIRERIEAYRIGPERRRGTARVTTLGSFIALVNRHKDTGSAIFAETKWPQPSLTAVIDYHDENKAPRHGEHRIVYTFPITAELTAWISQNGKAMEQLEFARFLEEHAAELAAPTDGEKSEFERLFKERFAVPIELIDLSRSLEVHVGAKVKQGVRLQSGERTIEFTEEHTNAKGEAVEIPGIFMVSVPAFLDGDPVRIPARLRYRIVQGALHWSYSLYRWEFWLRDHVQLALAEAAKETELPAFEGQPEP